ncbi:hypothetical protein [Dyella sp.]|jgi:hypothetical protein|uniref:hypothetical protein n=1 Tax=Dyella sp. TaxID=1869338 RepID=UPI002D780C5C|nr:hypothetical protein [Dyella sp.]HET6431146.1 hypothetical protein [Dyella sp.]
MNVPDLSQLPYRHPPMTRGVDPKRMNWLWRLICELGSIDANEVMASLHAAGVPVDLRRVRSWTVNDRDASFFPMTLAEMERNVRTVLALRLAQAEAARNAADAPPDAAPADVDADATAAPAAEAGVDAAVPAADPDAEAVPLEW